MRPSPLGRTDLLRAPKFAFVEGMGWAFNSRRDVYATVLLGLALLAGVARGVLPSGYMVNAGLRPGEIAIVLCAAHGTDGAALDLTTGAVRPLALPPPAAPGKPGADPPCLFAAAALAAPPESAPSIAAPLGRLAAAADSRVAAVAIGQGLAAPPPPATGPPVSPA